MGIPHKVSAVTAHMGQNSSQLDTSINTEQGNDDTINRGESKHERRKEKKGKKRKRASLANALQEVERAHAVLPSQEDLVDGSWQSSYDDDLAASLQLQAENSSPSRPRASHQVESNPSKNSDEVDGDVQAPEGRKKRRKRRVLETPVAEFENSKSTIDTSHTDILPIQSLDDINTEDEAIASYLRGYENDQTITPLLPHSEDVESESEMENLAAKVARDGSPILMQSTYQLPSNSSGISSKSKKDGQMRKQEFDPDLEGEETNTDYDLPNGTGQHTFDEEAIDRYLNSMLNSADDYYQAPSYDIPIDPEIAADGDNVMPGAEPSLPEIDFDFTESPASSKKLSRAYSSRKSRSKKVNPKADAYALPRDGSPFLDHEEQDQITPGAEDLRSHISDTGSLLGDSNKNTSPRSSLELVITSERTPPPLAKRSKPRGNKTQQGGQKAKNYDPPLAKIAQKGGMFTQLEMAKVDALRDTYCEEQGIHKWKFNEFIHAPIRGNRDVVELWDSIHELFPYRTRMSVSRFCRRRFHNFSARGVWTESEDEMLRRAVAEKGNSWKAVGALINRFPEDCRDRYRNYHVNAANRNREQWTEAEVKNLCWAVYDCMLAKKEEKRRARKEEYRGRDMPESEPEDSDQEIEEMKLINWQAVSDRMGTSGGARSRLQCSFKWGKLKNAERDQYMKEVRAMMKGQKRRKGGKVKAKWRFRQAIRKLRNMKSGDRHDFLQALLTCDVEKEENIPWRLLGDEQFRARWTTKDKKAAWEMFKKKVPGSDSTNYRDVVQHLLAELVAEEGDRLHERWDPDVDGDINSELRRQRKRKREGKRVHGSQEESVNDATRYKSRPIVVSDAEDQDGDEQQDRPSDEEAENPGSAASGEEQDMAESRSPDVDRDAEQSEVGGQQLSAKDHSSDDSLFQSNSDDGDDEGLFLSG